MGGSPKLHSSNDSSRTGLHKPLASRPNLALQPHIVVWPLLDHHAGFAIPIRQCMIPSVGCIEQVITVSLLEAIMLCMSESRILELVS